MKNFSTEKYIGIPYQEKGRTFSGVDCWGLACLVYKTEFDIDLPSYDEHYELDSEDGIAELIAREKEGWQPIEVPEVGDLALFKIFGHAAHIGIVVDSRTYLEVRENRDTVLERFDSVTSKKRLVGYFKYIQNCSTIPVVGAPHPLQTRVTRISVPAGINIRSVVKDIEKYAQTPQEYEAKIKVFLNGTPVPENTWDTTFVQNGDQVEYRILPGKKYLAPILLIAVAIIAPQLATAALQYSAGVAAASGATIGATLGAAIYYGTYAATLLVGSALAAKISPIRPPSDPKDPGTPERQLMFNGASNQVSQYGTIPIILGKIRTTPLLGAVPRLYSATETQSNIAMLAIWGYGPLYIDKSSYKIGEVPLANYTVNSIATVGYTGSSEEDTDELAGTIYGKDYDIYSSGVELTCDGDPADFSTDPPSVSVVDPGPWVEASATDTGNHLASIDIHFPQGLRGIFAKGSNAGKSFKWTARFEIQGSYNGTVWFPLQQANYERDSKDGFTATVNIAINSSTKFIRIRRLTPHGDEGLDSKGDLTYRLYSQAVLLRVSFVSNRKPVLPPKNCLLAKTAIDITATDQLNGNMQGFNGIVQTWGKKWTGNTWTMGVINNPGELFRHVLEHPANPRKIASQSQLDLEQIQYFCDYCNSKGFTFNAIMGAQKSVLDTLRDICAAGRASPALRDGKWTVVIDEEKQIVQHFTPHNSWGFEGSKALPRYPHGIRVTFYDEEQNYQEVETIIYDVGFGPENASLFESISLPGVTKKSLVIDHVKWHFAQIKLRPEIYTFNTDIEYLVCTRGDRVKVTHDVPLWGRSSGRVLNKISNTTLEVDEPVYMEANKQYFIRIRLKTGQSFTSIVLAKPSDGYYTQITIQTGIEAEPGDLFMFGDINKESQDLLVLSIEPSTNKSARLTLVDYGVTGSYNIFTDYINLSSQTIFETQITLPPLHQQAYFGELKPTPTTATSDISVMEEVSSGMVLHTISLGFYNPVSLPVLTRYVEAQYYRSDNVGEYMYATAEYQSNSIRLPNVLKGITYTIRLRYVASNGVTGLWTNPVTHTVTGIASVDYDLPIASLDLTTKYVRVSFSNVNLPQTFNCFRLKVLKTEDSSPFWNSENPGIKTFETSESFIDVDITSFQPPRLSESGVKYRFAFCIVDKSNTEIGIQYIPDLVIKTINP